MEQTLLDQKLTLQLYRSEQLLPELLDKPEIWRGKDVLYHAPRVERIWVDGNSDPLLNTVLGESRLSLHIIHPTTEPCLYHPHPWPSIIHILHGGYEMGIGYSEKLGAPVEICKTVYTAGATYLMTNPAGWHYVKPLKKPSLSIMISDKPWGREMPIEPSHGSNPDMDAAQIAQLIKVFKNFF